MAYEGEEGVKVTLVTLRIPWDTATQDHPYGWDWITLLDEPGVQAVDFQDQGGSHDG